MLATAPGHESARLPEVMTYIAGLKIGDVRRTHTGEAQVYFGGSTVEHLIEHDSVELRDGAVHVDMYTIDNRADIDYAVVTINTPATHHTPLERARARRFGDADPAEFVERTPVQHFISKRGFMDIPISGRARWLALDPDGNFSEGIFDDREADSDNRFALFGEGWTFAWVVEGCRPFVFGEVCSPRFIDSDVKVPLGEDGIKELNSRMEIATLPEAFQEKLAYYTSGEQLRNRPRAS
jgi:hypothetical protein